MQKEFRNNSCTKKPTIFGRSLRGNDLEEYQWGNKDKSILFLTGFTSQEHPFSDLLIRWKNHLEEAEQYGGILGDFDLKTLKNKCRIRIIPALNPDALEINRNGLKNAAIYSENPLQIEKKTKYDAVLSTNSRGVDLNRNFNADWIKMRQTHPDRRDLGPFPESEAETAALTAALRRDLPASAIILRYGENDLHYPKEATAKELREAVFLGQYSGLSVSPAINTEGTALQWLTDRGVKVVEICLPDAEPGKYPKLRDLLTMCAALT